MSHGKLGAVLGVDWKEDDQKPDEFLISNIFKLLAPIKCPHLVNKPKIIIIQACRGGGGHKYPIKDWLKCSLKPSDCSSHCSFQVRKDFFLSATVQTKPMMLHNPQSLKKTRFTWFTKKKTSFLSSPAPLVSPNTSLVFSLFNDSVMNFLCCLCTRSCRYCVVQTSNTGISPHSAHCWNLQSRRTSGTCSGAFPKSKFCTNSLDVWDIHKAWR